METRTRFVLMIWVRDDEIMEEDVMEWKLSISILLQGSQVYLRAFFKGRNMFQRFKIVLAIRNG